MHSVGPARQFPAFFARNLAVLKISKLPKVLYTVKVTQLCKPSTNGLHYLLAALKTLAPVLLPFEQAPRKDVIGAQLKDAAKVMGLRSATPEIKLLHEIRLAGPKKRPKLFKVVEVLFVGMHRVLCVVKALVAFVLPDVS